MQNLRNVCSFLRQTKEHRKLLELSWGLLGLPFPHHRPCTKLRVFFASPPLSHHKTHLNFTQLNTPQLNSSHLTFGPSPGLILEPLGLPNRPKIGPSHLLTPHFFQKGDFSRNAVSPRRNPILRPQDGSKTTPKTSQDRPKTAPRRSSRPSFFVIVFVFDFGPSWVRFCFILAPLWAPKSRASPGLVGFKMTLNDP